MAWSHSHSVPNKQTEAYINYKLFGLLFRLITNDLLQLKLTPNSYRYLAMWLEPFSSKAFILILFPLLLDDDCVSTFPLPKILLA